MWVLDLSKNFNYFHLTWHHHKPQGSHYFHGHGSPVNNEKNNLLSFIKNSKRWRYSQKFIALCSIKVESCFWCHIIEQLKLFDRVIKFLDYFRRSGLLLHQT